MVQRKKYRLLTIILAAVMLVACSLHIFAAASPAVTKDGLTVQVLTDKDSYKADETIKAVVRVDNNTGRRVVVETSLQLPIGVSLISEANSIDAILQPAEYWTTPDGFLLLAGNLAIANPATGDNLQAGFWVIMAVLAVGGLIALLVYGKNKRTWLSILLCLAMVGGIVTAAIPVQAEEITGTIEASCHVEVEGKTKEVIATVNYTILDEEEENAESQPTEAPTATPEPSEEPAATPEPTPEIVHAVLFETDFEKDTVGNKPTSGGSRLYAWSGITEATKKMVRVEEVDGNQLLHIYVEEDGEAGGPRAAKNLTIEGSKDLTIEFKVKTDVATACFQQYISSEQKAQTIWTGQSAEWTEVKIVMDMAAKTWVTYVNGEQSTEAGTLEIPEGTTTVELRFHGGTLQPGTGVYYDDIKVTSNVLVGADQILTPNNTVNWSNVKPTKALSDDSFVNNLVSHPRIFVSEWDEVVDKIQSNEEAEKWYGNLKDAANSYLSGAPARVVNSRGNVLESARAGCAHLQALAFVYNVEKLTGNADADKYLKAAYEQMVEMGAWEDWNGFTSYLVTAELMFGYACAYDWLYDELTEPQRAEIFDIVQEQALTALVYNYEGVTTSTNFTTNTINWNPLCNGSAIGTALAFADEEPEIAEYILERGPKFIVNSLTPYAPEGAYPEGVSYWDLGTTYLIFAADMLENSFVEGFELLSEYHYFDASGMAQTGDFPIYFTGPTGRFNYGDCVSGVSSTVSFYWLANQFNKPQYAWYENKVQEDSNSYLTGYDAIAAICFYDPENVQVTEFSEDKFYGAISEADAAKGIFNGISMRSDWEDDALFAAMQGGNNSENHQHLSLGTYVIDYHGERFIKVLAQYDYNLKGQKNEIYYKRAEAYNTLVINPSLAADQELNGYANLIKSGSGSDTSFGILDMSKAYTAGDATILSAKRGIMLTDNRNRVVIQDEVKLDKDAEFYWYANTDADAKIAADKKSAILTLNGERMLVRIIKGPDSAAFEMVEAKSTIEGVKNDICGEQKLAIHVTDVSELNLAVEYVGLEDGEGIPAAGAYVPLADWAAKDKDIEISEGLEITVKVDGEALSFFEMDREAYALDYASDVTTPPTVTVEATGVDSSAVQIVQATTIGVYGTDATDTNGDGVADDTARITVTAGDKTYAYYIKMQRDPFEGISSLRVLTGLKATPGNLALPEKATYIEVQAVTASSFNTSSGGTYPENGIVDGVISSDVEHRWGAQGADGSCWIQADFGESKSLYSMAFAGDQQDKRAYEFDVMVSTDGETWTTVHEGGVGTTKAYMNVVDFSKTDTAVNARYVKLVGYGNSVNTWNSYTEVRFYESATQQAEDISYWDSYFGVGDFAGKAGEKVDIILCGIDSHDQEFELSENATITYTVADVTVAKVVTESGVDKLEFLMNGTTTMTITATQDGFSASTTVDINCEGSVDTTKYTVNFVNYDESTITEEAYNFELTKGSPITVPEGPERESDDTYSYTFKGWKLKGAEGAKLIQKGDKIAVAGNATYIADYEATERVYTVKFTLEDGTILDSITGKANSKVTLPASLEVADTDKNTYTQYTITKWTAQGTESATVDPGSEITVTADVTYVVKSGDYSAIENTLLFYTDGSGTVGNTPSFNSTNPSLTQFTGVTQAKGETTDGKVKNITVKIVEDTMGNQYIQMYGEQTHTAGKGGPRVTRAIDLSTISSLTIETKVMTAGNGTAYININDGSDHTVWPASSVSGWTDVKIFMDKKDNQWYSTAYVNGTAVNGYIGKSVTAGTTENIQVRFIGNINTGDSVCYDDIKIYVPPVAAEPPVEKVTINFVDDAGQFITEYSQEVDANTEITMPAGVEKAEDENYTYTFAGWKVYVDGEVTGDPIAVGTEVTVTENVTYKATYTETAKEPAATTYTIKFVDYAGNELVGDEYNLTLEQGETISVPAGPTRADNINTSAKTITKYTFTSWKNGEETLSEGATATANVTYQATYTEVTSTLLFYTDGSYANSKNQPDYNNKSTPGITQFNGLTEATGEKDGVNRELIVRLAADPTDSTNQVIKLYGTENHAGSASSPRATRKIAMSDITELIIEAKAMVALPSVNAKQQAYISLCDGTKNNNPTVWSDSTVMVTGTAPSWKNVKIKLMYDDESKAWTSNTYVDDQSVTKYQNVVVTLSTENTVEVRFNGTVSKGDSVYYDDIKIYTPITDN